MLALPGRVGVLHVGVVELLSGTTVYREGKHSRKEISKQHMVYVQMQASMMT